MKYIKQHDQRDCGPACLAMLSQYFGGTSSVAKIREFCKTDQEGTTLLGMIKGGEKLGITIDGVKADDINDIELKDLPLIAHITNDNKTTHFVIIEKIKGNTLYIVDPAKGKYKVKKNEFVKKWTNILLLVESKIKYTNINPKDNSNYLMLKSIVMDNKKSLIFIFLFSLIINILGIIGTYYFKFLIDNIIPSGIFFNLHILTLLFIFLYLIKSIIDFTRSQISIKLSIRIDRSLMTKYYSHVLKMSYPFFERRKSGELLSRFNDIAKVREALSSVTITILIDFLMIIIGGILLFLQSTILFYITLVLIPIYLLIGLSFRKPLNKYNRQVMESSAELSSTLIESFSNYGIIKDLMAEEHIPKKNNIFLKNLLEKVYALEKTSNYQRTFTTFMKSIITIIILWIGSYLVIKNQLTVGTLLTFNALVMFYLDPMERLINLQPIIESATVANKRLLDILNLNDEFYMENSKNKVPYLNLKNADIQIKNLNFQYNFKEEVLNDINLKIPNGKTIGIVGESGSGKSTIAKLLANYYEDFQGLIKIGGHDINNIQKQQLRSYIGYVDQKNFVFGISLKENICLGINQNSSEKEIEEACRLSCAEEFIKDLPQGLDTILESNGSNLSTGQLQRLSLARIFLKKPSIVILDEVTSALDTNTEKKVLNNINELKRTSCCTIVMITHKLNNVKNADCIYTLKNGNIMESGSHNELLKIKKSYYNSLWQNNNN